MTTPTGGYTEVDRNKFSSRRSNEGRELFVGEVDCIMHGSEESPESFSGEVIKLGTGSN